MLPIHELLNRIRWDAAYAQGNFVIGYYDRVEKKVIQLPFDRVRFDPDDRFRFQAIDPDGQAHAVPFHRVRAIYQDGRLIWYREG